MMKKIFFLIILFLAIIISKTSYCAVDMDGTDDFISVPDLISNNNKTEFSLSVWVKFDTDTNDDYIIGNTDSSDGNFIIIRDDVDSVTSRTDCITVVVDTVTNPGNDYRLSSATNSATADGNWHNIIVTFSGEGGSGSDELNIYIDGVADANNPAVQGNALMEDTDATFYLGAASTAANTNMFNGKITEFAYWESNATSVSAVLSSHEISLLANSKVRGMPLQIKTDNLVAYLPLNDISNGESGDGDTFFDQKSAGYSGTGNDGANNTGLLGLAEEFLSYP